MRFWWGGSFPLAKRPVRKLNNHSVRNNNNSFPFGSAKIDLCVDLLPIVAVVIFNYLYIVIWVSVPSWLWRKYEKICVCPIKKVKGLLATGSSFPSLTSNWTLADLSYVLTELISKIVECLFRDAPFPSLSAPFFSRTSTVNRKRISIHTYVFDLHFSQPLRLPSDNLWWE